MGREVRKVPKDFEHPENHGKLMPLYKYERYEPRRLKWLESLNQKGLQATLEYCGNPPNLDDYMPEFASGTATWLMMYETTSEGTPISPAFETPEELAHWLTNTKASSFASMTATYDQWLAMIKDGWAPSAISVGGRLMSGVEASAEPRP